jgi:hypothetical protein
MIIPIKRSIECQANTLLKRADVSTAESFKSWNTCMDNRTCKIVAIVGIVVAALVVFAIMSWLVRCLCCGLSCCSGCLGCGCCDCCGSKKEAYREPKNDNYYAVDPAYNNPNMYPQGPPQSYNQYNQYVPQQQLRYGPGVISDESNGKY